MIQYINKSDLVAEITRQLNIFKYNTSKHSFGRMMECSDLLVFINTLEVKEVNLEKEVMDWWNTHYSSKDYTFERYTGHYLENSTLIEIAKHFFELGIKAQKGE